MRKLLTIMLMAAWTVAAAGCAGTSVTWHAVPDSVNASIDGVALTMVPLRQGNPFYSAFRLTVTNSGHRPVAVDWNRCEYRLDDRPGGRLWFKGLSEDAIREGRMPVDKVLPGESLSRVVAPIRLVAITPIRDSTRNLPAFSPGRLPAGKNAIRVTLIPLAETEPVSLTVTLTADDAR